MKPYHQQTQLVTLGREESHGFPSVSPPVYRTSTVLFPSLQALHDAENGKGTLPSYGRAGNPTTHALEESIAHLQGADGTVLTASGLAAITTAIMAFVKHGDHILVTDAVYGPTRAFCNGLLKNFGVETTFFDPLISGDDLRTLIKPNSRLIFLESPGSLTFEMHDIEALADVAHAHDMVVLSDDTWATLLHFQPFDWGIDISIHSATKYIGGHSDILMGAVNFRKPHADAIRKAHKMLGACSNSDQAWLASRGVRTLGVRLKQHQESALEIASWLASRPEVKQVLCPMLPTNSGYNAWKRYMTGGCGLFSIELHPINKQALAAMVDHLELFGIGFSWGGFESLVIPFFPEQCRTASTWAKDTTCLRLHIGLEHPDDLMKDLEAGFKRIHTV